MQGGGGRPFACDPVRACTPTVPGGQPVGVSDLGPYYMADGGWHGNRSEYTTAVVGNASLSWLRKVSPGAKQGKPFFIYIVSHAIIAGNWARNPCKIP